MNPVPIMADFRGRPAVVVGAGGVATRRIHWLLEAGARVTVVAPEATESIREWAEKGVLTWKRKFCHPKDLGEARIVVAATDSPETNQWVAVQSEPRQWVNVVDKPEWGNFQVPAQLTRGQLILAVSTGGASPVLARKIRDLLSECFDETWAEKLEGLAQERRRIKESGMTQEEKRERLKQLAEEWLTAGWQFKGSKRN